ncbi:MAG TPA: hypothetical protein VGJ07_17500 [Rugosimonospora sp.]|jgi:hypothetical protein
MAPTRGDTVGRALRRIWSEDLIVARIAYVTAAVVFTSGLVHLCVLVVSGGSWEGPLSMRKPTTFGLSFGLTLATVAWATSFLAMSSRVRAALLGAFTVVCVVEPALVTMQAWRGVPSHFNFETGFDTVVSMSLAAGGAVIILTAVGFTAAAVLGGATMAPSMRVAVRFGFVILLVALATGAVMIARGVVQARTGHAQLAYTTAGALKPLHAVAMHAILVVPGLAWLLRFTDWSESRRVRLVWTAIASYAVLTVVVGVEVFAGISPLDAPAVPTVLSLIAVLALVSAGVTALSAVLRASAGRRSQW